ncbi:mucin-2-like [Chironomus tepperi]|uniref:mucin-2-like n=1 Tax=Chironomus tepperi TaxID=113505 RepID=UPI00391F40BE
MEIPTPPVLTTVLSTNVPDQAQNVTKMSTDTPAFISSTPLLTTTMRIPTPPLLTAPTTLTETSTLVTTATAMSTTKADMLPSIPMAPTIFKTTTPELPVIEQLEEIEEDTFGVDLS